MTRMAPAMRPVSRPKLYEQIVERIHDHVVEAGLRPGDRLPPERELAARLGVSRASVSQALVALEVLGTVSVRHGDGAVLLAPVSRLHLVAALRAHQDRLPEVIEARDALEGRLAALAAERRTDADLAAIDATLDAMAKDIDAGGRGVEGDEQFHAAVTRAGHSALLASLMQEIAELIRETRLESLGQSGRPQASLASHREIAEAIRRQDAEAASKAMHDHITLVSDVALLRRDLPA
jgi:GntR family transcriptional regulator, transcriptional repressor for pyruvate dehydrogenase complex